MTHQTIDADQIRQRTSKALDNKQRAQYDKADEERRRIRETEARIKRNMSSLYKTKWLPAITKAANGGENEVYIEITSYDGKGYISLQPQFWILIEQGVKFLKKKKFGATEIRQYTPRAGCDDDYGDKTDVYIKVTW